MMKEFSLKDSGASHHLEVQVFLILERESPARRISSYRFFFKRMCNSLGRPFWELLLRVRKILLSLRWDKPRQRFVASPQPAGSVPILSFIPFALPGDAHDAVPPEFSMTKSFALNSDVSNSRGANEKTSEV